MHPIVFVDLRHALRLQHRDVQTDSHRGHARAAVVSPFQLDRLGRGAHRQSCQACNEHWSAREVNRTSRAILPTATTQQKRPSKPRPAVQVNPCSCDPKFPLSLVDHRNAAASLVALSFSCSGSYFAYPVYYAAACPVVVTWLAANTFLQLVQVS